jgi:NOL1/NOP2/fmu family ribosome biogenesis protein
MDIWPALRENGLLIYSTCTFNPGENEENIKWLISKNEAECIRLDINAFDGITEIDFQGIYGYGFYPDKVKGEGFFISAIRKKRSPVAARQNIRPVKELQPGKSDLKVSETWTDFKSERILKWGEEIIGVPCDMEIYTYLFKNLKVVKAGTRIAVLKKNDALPFHELALSVRLKKEAFPYHELSTDEAISYLRRDNFTVGDVPKGWNIVTYKGVNLGFIKNLGNRLNNYYPVDWRIRLDASAIRRSNPISWYE